MDPIKIIQDKSFVSEDMNLLEYNQIELETLEQKLSLLHEDKSIPIPRNTIGMILLVPKIWLGAQVASTVLRKTRILGYFIPWSNPIYLWGYALGSVLHVLILPFLVLVIFHSKILFGEEIEEDNEGEEEMEDDTSERRKSSISHGISLAEIERRL